MTTQTAVSLSTDARTAIADALNQCVTETVAATMMAQEILGATLTGAGQLAAEHGDTLTEDLAVDRGRIHEKFAWILRAHLK